MDRRFSRISARIGIFSIALLLSVGAYQFLYAQTAAPVGQNGIVPWTVLPTAADTATVRALDMTTVLAGTPTAAANYTTDTATNLCALFPQAAAINQPVTWDWYLKNTSAGANTITLVAGTGVTIVGTATTAQNNVKHFMLTVSGCGPGGTPAAKVHSLGTSTF